MYQEKLDLLLKKYDVPVSARMDGTEAVEIGGKEYPILSHRAERRFAELRKMLHNGTTEGMSAVRCGHVAPADVPLYDLIRRELDIARFITGQEIVGVTAFVRDDRAATLIAELDGGPVCSMEVANTLPEGAKHIDKHEVITARGLVCDRVVDSQIPAQSIYLYGETEEAYTDVDFELYGLDQDEVAAVRFAFALAKDQGLREETLRNAETLDRLIEAVQKSAETGERIPV
ncbi:MAG: hypothetical protein E7576_10485 [Ruminococcaceae bacterium]|nr:hypothetical protein [Oscillospiraceae bacterium]